MGTQYEIMHLHAFKSDIYSMELIMHNVYAFHISNLSLILILLKHNSYLTRPDISQIKILRFKVYSIQESKSYIPIYLSSIDIMDMPLSNKTLSYHRFSEIMVFLSFLSCDQDEVQVFVLAYFLAISRISIHINPLNSSNTKVFILLLC